ncbi:protein MGARP isoform X1 [Electrophorus electricus]|uniref:protein MGARP isoform X1 n=1 Tax=Electrophorus electricus TaxID=8005 RepID=UPI0015CFBCB8|nr:protein MGARP isoform X1 [Electrophorus electricus]
MFLCRVAGQRCAPLAAKSLTRLENLRRGVVPWRLMSSVPGGSGKNWVYAILCGGAFTGAMAYTYSTVSSDSARFADRISEIQTRPKSEWQPKPWRPKRGDEAQVVEAAARAVGEEAGLVELAAEDAIEEVETPVEVVAEAITEAAEVVAEVATVVEEVAEEVAAVAQEVEGIAEKVEMAAEAFEAPKLLAEETIVVEEVDTAALEEPTGKSSGTPAASPVKAESAEANAEC